MKLLPPTLMNGLPRRWLQCLPLPPKLASRPTPSGPLSQPSLLPSSSWGPVDHPPTGVVHPAAPVVHPPVPGVNLPAPGVHPPPSAGIHSQVPGSIPPSPWNPPPFLGFLLQLLEVTPPIPGPTPPMPSEDPENIPPVSLPPAHRKANPSLRASLLSCFCPPTPPTPSEFGAFHSAVLSPDLIKQPPQEKPL